MGKEADFNYFLSCVSGRYEGKVGKNTFPLRTDVVGPPFVTCRWIIDHCLSCTKLTKCQR